MKRWGTALFLTWLATAATGLPPRAQALELAAGTGFLQLPSTSYHYLAYDAQLAVGSPESKWLLDFGLAQPFSIAGYSENIVFFDLGGEWSLRKEGFLRPFVGAGLGFYDDQVNGSSGVVPSIVMRGGLKAGGDRLGAALSMNAFLGVYSAGQLFSWVMWPMTSFWLGFYVAL
jgi:hypothetical protein